MVKIGIMGLGNISHRVAKGILHAKNAELAAVASRDIEKALAFQKQYGSHKAYGNYEDLLADDHVDLIYICTPNHLHYTHILSCLQHNKHVICEKPLVSNMEQLKECFAIAKKQNCFLMEAEKTLFTPLNQKIKQMIKDGCIGKLQYIEGSYASFLDIEKFPSDFWGFRKDDGGCAYDIGVYPICYANFFADGKIHSIQGLSSCADKGYVDFMQCLLQYDNGIVASVRSSWKQQMENKGFLYGTKGVIETVNFWKNTSAVLKQDGKCISIDVSMASDFTGEIEHAADCIEKGYIQSPILNEEASIEIMKVLEYVKNTDI